MELEEEQQFKDRLKSNLLSNKDRETGTQVDTFGFPRRDTGPLLRVDIFSMFDAINDQPLQMNADAGKVLTYLENLHGLDSGVGEFLAEMIRSAMEVDKVTASVIIAKDKSFSLELKGESASMFLAHPNHNEIGEGVYADGEYVYVLADEPLLRKLSTEQNMEKISRLAQLSDGYIEDFKGQLNWVTLCAASRLSEATMRRFKDYVAWEYVGRSKDLSEDFIVEFKDKLDFDFVELRGQLTPSLLTKLGEDFLKTKGVKL